MPCGDIRTSRDNDVPLNRMPRRLAGRAGRIRVRMSNRSYAASPLRASDDARSRKLSAARLAALRAREIETVVISRYGDRLPADDAGRDDLEILIAHLVHTENGQAKAAQFARLRAPWLQESNRIELIDRLSASVPPMLSAFELACRLGVTWKQRTAFADAGTRLTTIGACDLTAAEFEQRRRARRAQQARERRKKVLRDFIARPQNARGHAILEALADRGWTSIVELRRIIEMSDAVKPRGCFDGLSKDNLRRVLDREIDRLRDAGEIEHATVRSHVPGKAKQMFRIPEGGS